MRKLFAIFVLLLAGSGVVWADAIPTMVDNATAARRTLTVFNNAGSTLTSGAVVVWDNDKVSFDRSGYRYITTTTTGSFIWTAGVMVTGSCADQSLCEISVEGWTPTNVTGNLTEDTLVATSTTAGRMGDYSPAADTCALGRLAENINLATGGNYTTCGTGNFCQMPVYVEISCQ